VKSDELKFFSESMPVVEVIRAEMDKLRNQSATYCEAGG
jgi:hypothetical protein